MDKRRYAVITGASSGIGLEFAKIFARLGFSLVLIARRKDRLEKIARKIHECYCVGVEILPADLSKPEECIRVFKEIKNKRIEVFINNAGFGTAGAFDKTSFRTELSMIDVNIKAVHIMTKFMVKYFEAHNIDGYILNTASSAGLLPAGPYMATYYATKAYVTSLTQAVAEELRRKKSGIYVGCLCPGPVDTEFNKVANVEFALDGISPGDCANEAVRQMFLRKIVIIPEKYIRFVTLFGRFVPRNFVVRMTAHQQKKKIG